MEFIARGKIQLARDFKYIAYNEAVLYLSPLNPSSNQHIAIPLNEMHMYFMEFPIFANLDQKRP